MTQILRRITSTKNPQIVHCVKLRIKRRYRDHHQRCLLIGKEIIHELQNSSAVVKTRSVFLSEDKDLHVAKELTQNVFLVSDHVMTKLTGLQSADAVKIVAEVDLPSWKETWTSSRVLALDGIQDPGNLGTLLRTCLSFGWGPVLLLENCCDPYNEKVLRGARGASFTVPLYKITSTEMSTILSSRNLHSIGATAQKTNRKVLQVDEMVRKMKKESIGDVCLFLGNEGQGLSPEIEKLCQELITIPQCNDMESLNVAIAGGILMYLLRNKDSKKDERNPPIT